MTRFCFLIGAPKAGTTSLFNYLSHHPEIAPCSNKEPNFFTIHYDRGPEWYFSLWDSDTKADQVRLDATTNLSYGSCFPDGSQNLIDFDRRHDVDCRFLYILRDPFKRIESHYTHRFACATDKSLEEALNGKHVMRCSRYAAQLDRYTSHFDRDRFLLIRFKDLKENPQAVLKRICRFMEIDDAFEFPCTRTQYNVNRGRVVSRPLTRTFERFPFLESVSGRLPKPLKRFILNRCFPTIRENFKLTDDQRRRVHDFLRQDMERLREVYNFDVRPWGF